LVAKNLRYLLFASSLRDFSTSDKDIVGSIFVVKQPL